MLGGDRMYNFFEIPIMEIVYFDSEDIIKTSTIFDDELPSDIFNLEELEKQDE